MATAVMTEVFKSELPDQNTITHRAKENREATYTNAAIVEGLVMAQLALAQKDPAQAFKAATALKILSLAASALERLHATKLRALGLDRENALPDELPVLVFRDLGPAELKALQKRDESDEEGEFGVPVVFADTHSGLGGSEIDESNDIVVEGDGEGDGVIVESDGVIVGSDEREEPAKPHPKILNILGGRLVKEARP